jgi:hypothetical protein
MILYKKEESKESKGPEQLESGSDESSENSEPTQVGGSNSFVSKIINRDTARFLFLAGFAAEAFAIASSILISNGVNFVPMSTLMTVASSGMLSMATGEFVRREAKRIDKARRRDGEGSRSSQEQEEESLIGKQPSQRSQTQEVATQTQPTQLNESFTDLELQDSFEVTFGVAGEPERKGSLPSTNPATKGSSSLLHGGDRVNSI